MGRVGEVGRPRRWRPHFTTQAGRWGAALANPRWHLLYSVSSLSSRLSSKAIVGMFNVVRPVFIALAEEVSNRREVRGYVRQLQIVSLHRGQHAEAKLAPEVRRGEFLQGDWDAVLAFRLTEPLVAKLFELPRTETETLGS